MPLIFSKSATHRPQHNGITDEKVSCYFVKDIILDKEIIDTKSTENTVYQLIKDEDKREPRYLAKSGTYVLPFEFGIGKFVMSDAFATCQIVLAKLKSGEFALLHSVSHLAENAFDSFYNIIKDNIDHIYFFSQKNPMGGILTSLRSRALYLDIAARIGNPQKITHYVVPSYHSIVADAAHNQIFICKRDFHFIAQADIEKLLKDHPRAELTPVTQIKTFEEAKTDMIDYLRLYPDSSVGENKYIKGIKKIIETSVAFPRFDFKPHIFSEQKHKETEKTLLEKVSKLIITLSKQVEQKRVLKIFGASDSHVKAQQIIKSLAVATSNLPTLKFKDLPQFFIYKEGSQPSLQKELADANVYEEVVIKLNAFASIQYHYESPARYSHQA